MDADRSAPRLAGPVVVDASVVVEYVVVLTLTEAATRLFHRAAEGTVELWAPDLLYAESVSALRRLVQLEAVTGSAAERAVGHLTGLPITATGTAALVPDLWKLRDFLTPYDACYVALAEELGAELVTGERGLAAELGKRRKLARYLGDL